MLRFAFPFEILALAALASVCLPAAAAVRVPDALHAVVTIDLRREADIGAGEVKLGDIAGIAGDDDGLVSRLRSLSLGRGLSAASNLGRPELARWLRAQAGLGSLEAAWTGATSVELKRQTRPLSSDRLVAAAYEQLSRALAPVRGQVVVKPAVGAQIELPAGRLQFRPRPLPQGIVPAKHMFVWVDVIADGQAIRAVPVSFEVAVFVKGWAVTRPTMGGSRIGAEAVVPEEVDATAPGFAGARVRQQQDTFRSPGELVLLRGDLRPGDVLTWQNAAPAPMVTRGAHAMLHLHGEAIEVESRVLVMQDGFLGQTVKVKAPGGTDAIVATVTGSDMVEAQE